MTRPNVGKLLHEGIAFSKAKHLEEEIPKIGNFRGGSGGLISEDGLTWAGKCGRQTLLRVLGYNKEFPANRALMFQGGETNELSWIENLKNSSYPGKIFTQDEIGVNITLPLGCSVTGRPDIVLTDSASKPLHLLELKQICSIWTAKTVLMGQPKLDHMIQTVFYGSSLGVTYDLCYTNRTDFAVNILKHVFPSIEHKLAKYCEFDGKGGIKKVLPFVSIFQLKDVMGTIWFQQLDGEGNEVGMWQDTIVTTAGVLKYYVEMETYIRGKNVHALPPVPYTLNCLGEKENYTQCGYCELESHCKQFGNDRKAWLENIPSEFVLLTKQTKLT